jgi:hypothetical protein
MTGLSSTSPKKIRWNAVRKNRDGEGIWDGRFEKSRHGTCHNMVSEALWMEEIVK